jgi:hypothetical protein
MPHLLGGKEETKATFFVVLFAILNTKFDFKVAPRKAASF